MKKYAKILCAVLIAAALCSSLLFTAGAQEGEPFTPSMTLTNYSGNSINDGANYKSSVDGNRVSGVSAGNAGQSSFLSFAKSDSNDPWLVAYANQDYSGTPASGNNLYVNVSTSDSSPFTVVGDGAKGYYVIDFDIASHGEMLPGFDVSVPMRRSSDGKGFPFSDEIYVGGYVTDKDAWSHVTIIGDIRNNVAKVYINGVYVGDGGKAVRNDTDTSKDYLKNDTQVVAQGFRIELTRNNIATNFTAGQNATFDNFAHRLFIDNGADLAAAFADGNITDWSGYTAGRSGEALPVVATVDGAEYRNFAKISQALVTNDTVNLEFLAKPLAPLAVCANTKINTNGMSYTGLIKVVSPCTLVSVSGNTVTTKAPFVSNLSETNVTVQEALSVVKYNHPDNKLGSFIANKYNVSGGRGMYKITDSYTGISYINERVHSGTVTNSSDTYNGWYSTNQKIVYAPGQDQHIVIDFDVALYSDAPYPLKTITRNSGGSGLWGNNDLSLNTIVSDYELGTFVHVTIVLSTDTQDATVFVNGAYKLSTDDNITAIDSGNYFHCLRTGGNSTSDVSFANVCMRESYDATLTDAIANKSITSWSGNIYTNDYRIVTPPSKVAIDGVGYYDNKDIENALLGNKKTPAVVKVLHPFDDVITVNCDANVYTYGQDVTFVDANGNPLTPDKTGVIRLDVPYLPVRVEESVNIVGGTNSKDVYDAIKYATSGNLFTSFVPSAGNWGKVGYRNSSLVRNLDTGDVLYRNALLNANGVVNADSTEYVDMMFGAQTFAYSTDTNNYIVVDFDFATDGSLKDDVSVVLNTGATPLLLKDLGILDGDTAHVTVVYDFTNNRAHAFVNGLYACTVEGGAAASTATDVTVDSFRLCTDGKTSAVCLDNVAIRAFSYTAEDDTLSTVADLGNVTAWDESIYNAEYQISRIPALATVDGRGYGSIDTLNKLLAIETSYLKSVELHYIPETDIIIQTEVVIETNGLDVSLDWNTGIYEFDPGIERYRGTRTGLAYASSKFIYTSVGTAYTFRVINAENCWSNASVAIWANKISRNNSGITVKVDDYDVVFYPYGEKMEPIFSNSYIENGQLLNSSYVEIKITSSTTYSRVSNPEYPVASSSESLRIYLTATTKENKEFAAKAEDMLYSANISTGVEFIFYVSKDKTVTNTGNVVTIDGKEYVAFVYELAPHEIDKVITVSFEVKDVSSVYTQVQDICFLDYVKALLNDNIVDKSLIVSLLNYANESHAFFNAGETMPEVDALISEYAQYLPGEELGTKHDTSALSTVIRSASMRLNSTPEFVFKVARGFRGTVTISYTGVNGPVEYSVFVNALSSEQNVTLKGMSVADVANDITISVLPYGETTPMVCQYSLSTYAQSIENNAFAVALYNYAKAALAYQTGAQHMPVN